MNESKLFILVIIEMGLLGREGLILFRLIFVLLNDDVMDILDGDILGDKLEKLDRGDEGGEGGEFFLFMVGRFRFELLSLRVFVLF